MYENPFNEYEVILYCKRTIRKNYTGTADEGKDFLYSTYYVETGAGNYILDILYTQKGIEYTKPKTAEVLSKHSIQEAVIESNNGGRNSAHDVGTQCRIMGNNKTKVEWFHRKDNKAIRIYQHSTAVQNLLCFPKKWKHMQPEFYKVITNCMKVGKSDHGDAPDVLAETVEERKGSKQQSLGSLFA